MQLKGGLECGLKKYFKIIWTTRYLLCVLLYQKKH